MLSQPAAGAAAPASAVPAAPHAGGHGGGLLGKLGLAAFVAGESAGLLNEGKHVLKEGTRAAVGAAAMNEAPSYEDQLRSAPVADLKAHIEELKRQVAEESKNAPAPSPSQSPQAPQ
jgi:hypothetical protein